MGIDSHECLLCCQHVYDGVSWKGLLCEGMVTVEVCYVVDELEHPGMKFPYYFSCQPIGGA